MMLKQIWNLSLICSFLLLFSCSKDQRVCCGPPDPDLFIFGIYFGECGGKGCISIFKMENEKLFKDTLDIVPYQGFLSGSFIQYPDSSYQKAKALSRMIPLILTNENKHVYGCPDCGDWGGMYLELKYGSYHSSWLIDLMNDDLPAELILFKDEVRKVHRSL